MTHVLAEQELRCFLKEHGDSRAKRELLIFWSRHPNARFAQFALCYALDCSRLEINKALRTQTEAGLVDTCAYHDTTLYSLTKNEDKRQPVLELAIISWDQLELLLESLEKR